MSFCLICFVFVFLTAYISIALYCIVLYFFAHYIYCNNLLSLFDCYDYESSNIDNYKNSSFDGVI